VYNATMAKFRFLTYLKEASGEAATSGEAASVSDKDKGNKAGEVKKAENPKETVSVCSISLDDIYVKLH